MTMSKEAQNAPPGAFHLKNVLPLVPNDNYTEPKLVCRQLFSHVYEDIKSVYTFFQFLLQQISK